MTVTINDEPEIEIMSSRTDPVAAITIGNENRDDAVVTFTTNGTLHIRFDRDGAEGHHVLELSVEALDAISVWANRRYLVKAGWKK